VWGGLLSDGTYEKSESSICLGGLYSGAAGNLSSTKGDDMVKSRSRGSVQQMSDLERRLWKANVMSSAQPKNSKKSWATVGQDLVKIAKKNCQELGTDRRNVGLEGGKVFQRALQEVKITI